jgi:hypothetical protein
MLTVVGWASDVIVKLKAEQYSRATLGTLDLQEIRAREGAAHCKRSHMVARSNDVYRLRLMLRRSSAAVV